jgi:glycine/D-amino acid oxidase-like deaminating enzyme
MRRRSFLLASAGLSLAGCTHKSPVTAPATPKALPFYDALAPIPPIRAHVDRIFRITVCLRPFRAAGPRLETERLNDKLVVHNYGHGGSGWSLSWGSAEAAVRMVLESQPVDRNLAVIGCGALGLTAAITAQRAGMRVTIYAKDRPPFVRSANATGSWTPDSRVALTSGVSAGFPALWESMARSSFAMYQSYVGMPGNPIEWTDRYNLSDYSPEQEAAMPDTGDHHGFVRYRSRIADLTPRHKVRAPQYLPDF